MVSKVKLYWNGNGAAPENISVQPRIFTPAKDQLSLPLDAETLVDPFADGNSKTVTVESKFVLNGLNNNPPNLYLAYDFLDVGNKTYLTTENVGLAGAFHILYVYGEDSTYTRGRVQQGRYDPSK